MSPISARNSSCLLRVSESRAKVPMSAAMLALAFVAWVLNYLTAHRIVGSGVASGMSAVSQLSAIVFVSTFVLGVTLLAVRVTRARSWQARAAIISVVVMFSSWVALRGALGVLDPMGVELQRRFPKLDTRELQNRCIALLDNVASVENMWQLNSDTASDEWAEIREVVLQWLSVDPDRIAVTRFPNSDGDQYAVVITWSANMIRYGLVVGYPSVGHEGYGWLNTGWYPTDVDGVYGFVGPGRP